MHKEQMAGLQSFLATLRKWKGKALMGKCMCDDGSCGPVIDSHLISNCIFGLIAKNGHVISFASPGISEIKLSMPEFPDQQSRPYGCREASTFRGFCQRHDSEIFKTVDSVQIPVSEEAVSLLAFRTYAETTLTKYQMTGAAFEMFNRIQPTREVVAHAMRDFALFNLAKDGFDKLTSNIKSGNFDFLAHEVIEFKGRPSFAASGMFIPYVDAKSRKLPVQDSWLSLTILPQLDSGLAILSWPRVGATSCEKLLKSIRKVADGELGNWFLKFALEHMERIYFGPEWWETIGAGKQKFIHDRFFKSLGGMKDWATYALPKTHFELTGTNLSPWHSIRRIRF